MFRTLMKSKLHRATITDANLHYMGSITLDPELMELADILPHEKVQIVDIDNGARLETYVISGERGSGDCCLNGAAARLVQPGDKVIVISYGTYTDAEARAHTPTVVFCDAANRGEVQGPETPATPWPAAEDLEHAGSGA
jgi:aspartate 1-decarboxylase